MEIKILHLIGYFLIYILYYGLAGYRDSAKEKDRKYRKDKGIENMPDYYQHENGWHFQTTGMWVIGLIFQVGILYCFTQVIYWEILILGFSFFTLDFYYYIFRTIYNKQPTLLPEHFNWFTLNSNPVTWVFGEHFSKAEFITALTFQTVVTWGAIIYITMWVR